MKRLLAAGSGDIYQICKVFRDAERGRWHNPEFTLIEWYRLGFDDAALMTEVEALIGELLAPAARAGAGRTPELRGRAAAARRRRCARRDRATSCCDAARRAWHRLRGRARSRCQARSPDGTRRRARSSGASGPCFICDYPASQAALARLKPGLPRGGGALRAVSGRHRTRERLSRAGASRASSARASTQDLAAAPRARPGAAAAG